MTDTFELNKELYAHIPTEHLIKELISRDCTEWVQIEHGQQFAYDIEYQTVNYTSHMPRSKVLIVDEEV